MRTVDPSCEDCKHEGVVNVDSLPEDMAGFAYGRWRLALRKIAASTSTRTTARIHQKLFQSPAKPLTG